GEAAVGGYNPRAARLQHGRHRRNGEIEQTIERLELALDAAALRWIDDGEAAQIDDVAGGDDVRAAEVHDDVAVGNRAELTDHLHRLVVDVEGPVPRGDRLGR